MAEPTREQIVIGIRAVIAGYFRAATERGSECPHRRMYFEDCTACYDNALEAVLAGEPQQETLIGIGYLERAAAVYSSIGG